MKIVYHPDGTFSAYHCNVGCIHNAYALFSNSGELIKAEFCGGAGKIKLKSPCKAAQKLRKIGRENKPEQQSKPAFFPSWENTVWGKR